MFGLTTATRVFVAPDVTDMRKGFDGLFGLVRDALGEVPLSGHLFLFANRDRTRVKVLVPNTDTLSDGNLRASEFPKTCAAPI